MVLDPMSRTELIRGDRRADRRYQFELELRFSYEERGVVYTGAGRTHDLSGGGIRFQTDSPPPNDASVELRIAWPFLLQNVCPLQLFVWGAILGTDARGTVLRMRAYEFRTCGQRSFDQTGGGGQTCSIIA